MASVYRRYEMPHKRHTYGEVLEQYLQYSSLTLNRLLHSKINPHSQQNTAVTTKQ